MENKLHIINGYSDELFPIISVLLENIVIYRLAVALSHLLGNETCSLCYVLRAM